VVKLNRVAGNVGIGRLNGRKSEQRTKEKKTKTRKKYHGLGEEAVR